MPDGMDLVGKAESGGVHVAKQPVAQRGLALDQILDFAMVQLVLGNRLQHVQVVNAVGRRFRAP